MSATTAAHTTADAETPAASGRAVLDAPRVLPPPSVRDAAEAALRRKSRRQGLLLMIASSAAMIALIAGILLSFR
jgi:hypothetical protein